jgi:hypothetical protein
MRYTSHICIMHHTLGRGERSGEWSRFVRHTRSSDVCWGVTSPVTWYLLYTLSPRPLPKLQIRPDTVLGHLQWTADKISHLWSQLKAVPPFTTRGRARDPPNILMKPVRAFIWRAPVFGARILMFTGHWPVIDNFIRTLFPNSVF